MRKDFSEHKLIGFIEKYPLDRPKDYLIMIEDP